MSICAGTSLAYVTGMLPRPCVVLLGVVLGVGIGLPATAATAAKPAKQDRSAAATKAPSKAPRASPPSSSPAAIAPNGTSTSVGTDEGVAPDCGRDAIAEAMRDLFPPAWEPARAVAAALLSRCRAVGSEGVLAAALLQTTTFSTSIAITKALATFRSHVATDALRAILLSGQFPAVRALTVPPLAAAGMSDDLVRVLGNPHEDEDVRIAALSALTVGGRPPDRAYLDWLKQHAGPRLGKLARDMAAHTAQPSSGAAGGAVAGAAPAGAPPGPVAQTPRGDVATPAAVSLPPAPSVPPASPVPPAPPARTGPLDGTPLAMGTATVAGAALMLNLSLLGVQDTTPQLLLGSAGAVIGFGTSWALSRFGVRPTMEQAAWFANTTAWGTLAGITIYSGSGVDNYKLRYGSLVAGEIAGMAAGVWSARRWHFTGSEIVMSDSLFLGAALAGFGLDRFQSETPSVTPMFAAAVVPTMVLAAIAGHNLAPTSRDVTLMTSSAVGGAWLGSLLASGATRTDLFASRQGQGGLLMGAGLGYLGGAAAGAFTEVSPLRLEVGGAGILAGNLLGLGVNMMATGTVRHDAGAFVAGDRDVWKLGAGLGGLVLGSAGFALAPHLVLGPRAPDLTIWGAGYTAGTYWLASAAGYHGQPVNETDTALLYGGIMTGAVAGGVTGLLLSRRFAPDPVDQWTAFSATAATVAAGWGTAALLSDARGAADSIGVATGAAVGLAGGALFTHRARLRGPSVAAGATGAAYGALLGSLVPSLGQPTWTSGRATAGGAMLGLGGGALAGAAIGELTAATGGEVAVPAISGVLGLGVGAGAGLLIADADSQPTRIGAVTGTAAFVGASVLADRWLHLSQALGPSAPGLALVGSGFGAAEGALLAGALDSEGTVTGARGSKIAGGMLMGGSAGLAAGLALSRRLQPGAGDLWFAAGGSLLLASSGFGLGELVTDTDGRGTTVATMSGAAIGLVGGALVAPHVQLTSPIVEASLTMGIAGAAVGALAPSLGSTTWQADRFAGGGFRVGLGVGLIGGGAAAQLTGASVREVTAVAVGSTLGLGIGLGAGSLWPREDTQAERIGIVAGVTTLGAASAFLVRPLHLADPLSPSAPELIATVAAHGVFDGMWLAALADSSGVLSTTPYRRLQGGILFGGSLGIATGFLLAPHLHLQEKELFLLSGATLTGAAIGRGVALLAATDAGRFDSGATLAGSLLGTAAGAIAISRIDPTATDAGAAAVGAGYGALVGALAASFDDSQWPGWTRPTTGGLLLGAGAGAGAGMATRMALRGDAGDVVSTGLGGGAGALTGIGWALLLSDDGIDTTNGESRHLRMGAAIGTVAGLGLGISSWSRLTLGPGDGGLIAAAAGLAAWNGALIPALGHASANDFDRRRMAGGFLAAAGTSAFAAGLLAPVVEVDADLIADASTLDATFTAAGAGVGALISSRADAPVAGMLAGGGAGLVLGGLLHDRIDFHAGDAPLLTIGAAEGLWTGAWLPYLLRGPNDVTDGQRVGGLAAGAFGGFGLAVLANTRFAPAAGDVAFAALGSGVGTAIGGGVALLSDDIRDQRAVALMLGGTAVGLAAGGVLAPKLRLDLRAAGSASIGGVLGTSEALLFAWSARAAGGDQYAGAALLGAGVGTTLGLASASTLEMTRTGVPAIAGFTAWGGWMGSFAGSLFARDAHEITAGGLLGSNLGLLAGYGLLRTGAVEAGDFGWLSLFGAVGTVVGAAGGAPFSSRGQPTPILAGLAIGPAVGMTVGALVLPRLRASRGPSSVPPTAAVPAGARRSSGSVLALAKPYLSGSPASHSRSGEPSRQPTSSFTDEEPSFSDGMPSSSPDSPLASSPEVTRDLEVRHRQKRRALRALDASVRIVDCAPLIGALPTPDSNGSGATPPLLVGITGRWH